MMPCPSLLKMLQIHMRMHTLVCFIFYFESIVLSLWRSQSEPWSKSRVIALLLLALIFLNYLLYIRTKAWQKVALHIIWLWDSSNQRSELLKWMMQDDYWQLYMGKAPKAITQVTKPIQPQVIQLSLDWASRHL